MGPAPMIRMVEMSVLLGIKSHGQGFGHKKRARMLRVPRARARSATLADHALAPGCPRARLSLDQIPQPRKGFRAPINRHFPRLRSSSYGVASPPLVPGCPAEPALVLGWPAQPKRRSREGWRPGLDLNQDKERCTALASTLSATGPRRSLPIAARSAMPMV